MALAREGEPAVSVGLAAVSVELAGGGGLGADLRKGFLPMVDDRALEGEAARAGSGLRDLEALEGLSVSARQPERGEAFEGFSSFGVSLTTTGPSVPG